MHCINGVTIHEGTAETVLPLLPAESVHTVVTSPPYWGLRDYGLGSDALGLEPTPELFVSRLVEVFREVRRVLRPDGTLWLNMGDTYAANRTYQVRDNKHIDVGNTRGMQVPPGLKSKDMLGMPWRVAFALQADGWYLRSDIIWHKPNPMPESVRDRPTKSHEYVFLLSKSEQYYYDIDAIREPHSTGATDKRLRPEYHASVVGTGLHDHKNDMAMGQSQGKRPAGHPLGRNRRTVWTIPTQPYPEAHFATFPEKLIEPCILAGAPGGGVVLDPFAGSGTTGAVAKRLGRRAVLIEPNAEYIELIKKRIGPPQLFVMDA